MNQAIEEFVQGKQVAIVGVSRSGKKFGNAILSELKQRGYQMFIVHPEAQEIAGETCYPTLTALQGKVDRAIICLPARQAVNVIRQAAEAGVKKVWLQQGGESPEAMALARETGIELISGKCILMYAPPVGSIHGLHRTIARIFGQL